LPLFVEVQNLNEIRASSLSGRRTSSMRPSTVMPVAA